MELVDTGSLINKEERIWEYLAKPCKLCGYCPYGKLVENYSLHIDKPVDAGLNELAARDKFDAKYICKIFGRDCPVFYHADPLYEENDLMPEQESANGELDRFYVPEFVWNGLTQQEIEGTYEKLIDPEKWKRGEKGYWLNTEKRIWEEIVKPCKLCGFCAYGQLVESFPIVEKFSLEDPKYSCKIFGHECPVFYHAAPLYEENDLRQEEIDAMDDELNDPNKKSRLYVTKSTNNIKVFDSSIRERSKSQIQIEKSKISSSAKMGSINDNEDDEFKVPIKIGSDKETNNSESKGFFRDLLDLGVDLTIKTGKFVDDVITNPFDNIVRANGLLNSNRITRAEFKSKKRGYIKKLEYYPFDSYEAIRKAKTFLNKNIINEDDYNEIKKISFKKLHSRNLESLNLEGEIKIINNLKSTDAVSKEEYKSLIKPYKDQLKRIEAENKRKNAEKIKIQESQKRRKEEEKRRREREIKERKERELREKKKEREKKIRNLLFKKNS